MLVITRKNGECLIIGQDIEVTVLKIRSNRVKLGIRGPADVPIHREEVQARVSRPSFATSAERTLATGLTVKEHGTEDRALPRRARRSAQLSTTSDTPRRRVSPDRETADLALERRIKNFLQCRDLPGLRDLDVEVRNGTVVVTGLVNTFYQKQLATSCCQRVAGVLSVFNEVQVVDLPTTCEGGA